MKKLNHTTIWTTALCLLPMLAGLLLWDKLPEQVPTHWNFAGEIDGYGSRAMAVLGLPSFMALMNLLVHFMLDKDPKAANMPRILKQISYWSIPVLTLFLMAITFLVVLGVAVRVQALVPLLCGGLFIAIGNYLPKCRQNYTMGIKTPWTLNSEENWNRTHRIGGYCFTIGGVLLLLCALPGLWWLMIPAITLSAVVPMAYSYILYRRGI
ncbi:MAG: SdpI family protein [Candidatus Pelethousia sp.]|nr:SdpI family protein [Candidatus Pelethousia sp.]